MHQITLSTINARYIHASLGLRYLLANMGELRQQTRLREFTLQQRSEDIAEALLSEQPRIIGFGVYIWNVQLSSEVIRLIRTVDPQVIIVIGGPEVSFELDEQSVTRLADHVICGQADIAFGELCRQLLAADSPAARELTGSSVGADRPARLITPLPPALDTLASPYPWYSDEDLAQRVLYVEASRGCPFKCEFCLSSLDKTALAFDLESFLQQMQALIERGARQFKFVDRTFNLKVTSGRRILEFFLARIDQGLFLHFELIPDRLPPALRELLPAFPAGSLQFEIGIQSFNPQVQQLISRRQDHARTLDNLRWLRERTEAHFHADLIAGLPAEDMASFARGFDLLYSLGPQEIQVGILKRLRGTPINRHSAQYDMRYMDIAPYRILSNRDIAFEDMQRLVRFARYWDLLGNSGRFPATLPLLLAESPFARFMRFCDWLFATTAQTHRIALPRLFTLLWQGLTTLQLVAGDTLRDALLADFAHNRLKGSLRLEHDSGAHCPGAAQTHTPARIPGTAGNAARRQNRHLAKPQRQHDQ